MSGIIEISHAFSVSDYTHNENFQKKYWLYFSDLYNSFIKHRHPINLYQLFWLVPAIRLFNPRYKIQSWTKCNVTQNKLFYISNSPPSSRFNAAECYGFMFAIQIQAAWHSISYNSISVGEDMGIRNTVALVLSLIIWKLKIKSKLILSFQKVPIANNQETKILTHWPILCLYNKWHLWDIFWV